MIRIGMKEQKSSSIQMGEKLLLQKQMPKTYHVYLKDEVLFKDLDEREFKVIWGRLFHSYYKEELTYSEITDIPNKQYEESSY